MSTRKSNGFEDLGEIFKKKQAQSKPPAYEWQDLALRIIQELQVPNQKRSSVFKTCKENSKEFIEGCLNDTKELCNEGEMWRYFFKLINEGKQK
jgi:hypothetical protein